MKKIKLLLITVLLSLSFIAVSGCFGGYRSDSDYKIEERNAEILSKALRSRDSEQIKELFAPNMIAEREDFDNEIAVLLEYYKGEFMSYDSRAVSIINDKHDGHTIKELEMSRDVVTGKDKYRFSIKWRVSDNKIDDNIGIWSMYVIRYADDPYTDYSYWGDGLWENGISINKPFDLATKNFTTILDSLIGNSAFEAEDFFASELKENASGFETSFNRLKEYFNVESYDSFERKELDESVTKNADGKIVSRWQKMLYDVTTNKGIYSIAINLCEKDLQGNLNVIWSLYIWNTEDKPENLNLNNLLWEDGIRVGEKF